MKKPQRPTASTKWLLGLLGTVALLGLAVWWISPSSPPPPVWTAAQIQMLRSLWLGSLPPVPADPTNALADDPGAATLGQQLFFDTRLSGNGEISCATCHQPQRRFTDGRARAQALGIGRRNSMSIVGAAYSPWLYWDGRKDSLWSQALAPLEAPQEHGGNRMQYARLMTQDNSYRRTYQTLFGPLADLSDMQRFPDAAGPVSDPSLNTAWQAMAPQDRDTVTEIFVNMGKAIAAYERRLLPGPNRFDRYVGALLDQDETAATLTDSEMEGLALFLGKANCTQCHNGPLLTNNAFHNTGILSAPTQIPDKGRIQGVREARADPFSCTGVYSDSPDGDCAELRFANTAKELLGALRTPSLRNLAETGPYMHAGQLPDLASVLDHYNRAPPAMIGHNEAKPLKLNKRELRALEDFLLTLSAPLASAPELLAPLAHPL